LSKEWSADLEALSRGNMRAWEELVNQIKGAALARLMKGKFTLELQVAKDIFQDALFRLYNQTQKKPRSRISSDTL